MPVYIFMMPAEVLTHPLSNPFAPLPFCYPFSSPCFHAVVLSVERVINRATRWCCNTFWKHYRSALALCAVMQESRRRPLISTMPATWLRARNSQFLHYRDRGWRNYGAEGYTCHRSDLSRVTIFSLQSRRSNYKNKLSSFCREKSLCELNYLAIAFIYTAIPCTCVPLILEKNFPELYAVITPRYIVLSSAIRCINKVIYIIE